MESKEVPPAESSSSKAPEAAADTPPAGGEETTSKKGAKKAEAKAKKEAEKARKAAEREAQQAAAASASSEDLAKDNYGDHTHTIKLETKLVHLREINEEHVGKDVKVRAWIQNSRAQGAKMAFVELREEGNWTVQGVVAASAEGKPVSKQMVKWVLGLKNESFITIEATVQKPLEPVKSAKVSDFELHLKKVYLVATAPAMLGLGMGAANRAVAKWDDEEENGGATSESTVPAVEGRFICTRLERKLTHRKVSPSQKAHQTQVCLPT